MSAVFETLANALYDLVKSPDAEYEEEEEEEEEEHQDIAVQAPKNLIECFDEIESEFQQLQTAVKELRQSYSNFGFNQEEFEALQVSVMAKFEETEVESDRAWKALCAAHDMSTELKEHSYVAQNSMGNFRTDHESVKSSINGANERLLALQCARDDIETARAALDDNRSHNEASKLATNVGFGVLTLGVWSVVGAISPYHSCTSAFLLEDQSRAIEQQFAENQAALTENQNSLSELEFERSVLDCQHALLHQALDQLPGVEELLKQKISEIDEMTHNIVVAKNAADPVSKRMTRLRDLATTVTRHPTLQKEYADVLIGMSTLGCMDVRRARILEQMLLEVSSYPAVIEDKSLENKLVEADEACQRMSHVCLGECETVGWFFHSRIGEVFDATSDTSDSMRSVTPDRSISEDYLPSDYMRSSIPEDSVGTHSSVSRSLSSSATGNPLFEGWLMNC